MEESLPPGFRFHPTDEELITYYLTPKISDFGFTSKAIADVDLNKCEPWDLPSKASMGEKEWYFFSLRDRKYPTGLRTNRATEAGYWKTTGKDKEIFRGGMLVGMKKTLVFYKGRAPKGEKTNWVMHEYRIETKHSFRPAKEEWVVCRVFQKTATMKKPQQTSSPQASLDSPDDNTNTTEFGDVELPNLNSLSSPSSSFIANPSFQGYHEHDTSMAYHNLNNPNLNPNISWLGGVASGLPSWSSSLLSPTLNTTVNSLLLKALQLRSYQAREGATADIFSLLPQVGASPFGSTSQDLTNTTIPISSPAGTVNNNIMNLVSTSSQQQQQQQPQDQPFNMDSLW